MCDGDCVMVTVCDVVSDLLFVEVGLKVGVCDCVCESVDVSTRVMDVVNVGVAIIEPVNVVEEDAKTERDVERVITCVSETVFDFVNVEEDGLHECVDVPVSRGLALQVSLKVSVGNSVVVEVDVTLGVGDDESV